LNKPCGKNLSSAFSTEIAATHTKQSENKFPKTRIYIGEPAILVSAVEKACPWGRPFIFVGRRIAMALHKPYCRLQWILGDLNHVGAATTAYPHESAGFTRFF
jgi:hypothetical protein